VNEVLPLIISTAPAPYFAVADFGLKWGGVPEFERVNGLHIIVTVYENDGTAFDPFVTGYDHRISGGFVEFGDQPHLLELAQKPFGVCPDIRNVAGIRGDTGKSQMFEEALKL
jgi:hypothetical protein